MLVGGQALSFWIAYYGTELDDVPPGVITKDADFLGDQNDVRRLAAAINGVPEFPRNMSILSGVVRKSLSANEEYEVDVLRMIEGLSANSVRKQAWPISDELRKARYFVMSPLDCLVSRLENLRKIENKRTDMGIWQARAAVRVIRKYIENLLTDGEEKEAIRAATEVLRIATHSMGANAYRRYGIDVMETVPIERYKTEAFREQQWRRSVARVEQLRAIGYAPPRRRTP
ncbi:MAG: hypothetical protein ACT4P9_01765 [Betaproteobacteria bacterium]